MNEEGGFCDVVLKYIDQVLMEDDLEENVCIIEASTLRAEEKSFYEALNNKDPSPQSPRSPRNQDITTSSSSSRSSDDSFTHLSSSAESNLSHRQDPSYLGQRIYFPGFQIDGSLAGVPSQDQSCLRTNGILEEGKSFTRIRKMPNEGEEDVSKEQKEELPRGKKSLHREGSDLGDRRSNKHFEVDTDESVLHDMFDRILSLCDSKDSSPDKPSKEWKQNDTAQESKVGIRYFKRGPTKREAIDMRSLLLKCMQSVAGNDHGNAHAQLKQIRSLSSPIGDGSQRLAHYFADSLEARLEGTEYLQNRAVALKSVSDIEVLRAFRLYLSAFPFLESSYQFASHTIMEVSQTSASIHIVHFGIVYGLQWIPLIHYLSKRPGGPPKLRITGIDFPQPGFRPDARVEETGHRLANYCERFNVPFEYNGIAMKWENIDAQDLKIEIGELLVVNCFYHLMYLPDETIIEDSPRDAVLKLIHTIKPDIFIQGVSNGTYNSPFFVSRFREALFHYSAWFDMMEAIVPRENRMRMIYEREIWGNEILNTIACEGFERIERPETYKQWQIRTLRAGFRQLPLKQDLLKELRAKVKSSYHKDFFVDEASHWLVEGWKGRVIFAFSCWKPA